MRRIAGTDLDVSTLCFGGNVFGWTVDASDAEGILDAYVAGGGNFIDTADTYSSWVPGNVGGESETILGEWVARGSRRSKVVLATKVGAHPEYKGLSAANIAAAVDQSLKRLQTDVIDLYYAHVDDQNTPLEETLHAFDHLVRLGKVRYLGASNYSALRLAEALKIQERDGLARFVAIQPHYSLVKRDAYEGELLSVCQGADIACMPYYALASGFLSGKYREGSHVESARSEAAGAYADERGFRILKVMDEVAAAHQVSVSAVALGWLANKPTVVAPIASARTIDQLTELLSVESFDLTEKEIAALDEVSAFEVK